MKLKQKFIGIITAFVFIVNACMGGMIPLIVEAAEKGVAVGNETVTCGTTSVELPLSLVGVTDSTCCVVHLTCDYPLEFISFSEAMATNIQSTTAGATYVSQKGLEPNFGSVKIGIAADAELGTYPVDITVEQFDDNGSFVGNPVGYSGSVTIEEKSPEIGIAVGNETVECGTTSVELPLSLVGNLSSQFCTFYLTCNYPLEILSFSGAMTEDVQSTSAAATYIAPTELETNFGSVKIGIADDAEPGTYPVNIIIDKLDDNGKWIENPFRYSGSVTIQTSETDQPEESIDSSLVTKYGDLNDDGKINVSDVVTLNLYLLNKTENPLDAVALANADCARDGIIDTADCGMILNYTAMVITYDKLGAL